jgi:hypothetical protein
MAGTTTAKSAKVAPIRELGRAERNENACVYDRRAGSGEVHLAALANPGDEA